MIPVLFTSTMPCCASILQEWFCVPKETLNNVLLKDFQNLPIIQASAPCVSTNISALNAQAGKKLISNYPNPFQSKTTITFETTGGHTLIQVFNVQGKLVQTLVDKEQSEGQHQVSFENNTYPPGVYYARLQNGPLQQVMPMLPVK